MKITLIITTYNWPEALCLVLKSIQAQFTLPHEIIVADDGSDNRTKDMISDFKKKSKLHVIHSWQEDKGFRVARSRNKAISKSSGDYIVLIDGDVILHPKFIHDHIKNAEKGCFIQGNRTLLNKNASKKILAKNNIFLSLFSNGVKNRKNALYFSLFSKIFSFKSNDLNGVKTCNMSFYYKDFIAVNGFNNEFEGWGREDSEFVVRLFNRGIKRKNLRFSAVQFHLWHNENSRKNLEKNDELLENSIYWKSQWCKNGITELKIK